MLTRNTSSADPPHFGRDGGHAFLRERQAHARSAVGRDFLEERQLAAIEINLNDVPAEKLHPENSVDCMARGVAEAAEIDPQDPIGLLEHLSRDLGRRQRIQVTHDRPVRPQQFPRLLGVSG